MMKSTERASRIDRGIKAGTWLAVGSGVWASPAVAAASPAEGTAMVATYTAGGLVAVVVVTFLLALGLNMANKMGVIGSERQFVFRQRLRLIFGSTLLMAAVIPYVALNFSMTALFPFVAGAGLIIAAWVWGATKSEVELDSDPV